MWIKNGGIDMSITVEKYGGTSVKDSKRLKEIATRIAERKKNNENIVVVVSAPSGMTDDLIRRAKEICEVPSGRELDVLLSTGEQVSIALLAMALKEVGVKAISYTASQLGILTCGNHNEARIKSINTDLIKEKISEGYVIIVPGFQGVCEDGNITTLGRGGSDTSAVAIAVALGCKSVDIYTDVDGIYSANPQVISGAIRHKEVSFSEMIEMAGSGAKVLHTRSVELGAKYGIEIQLRSAFNWQEGTWVRSDEKVESAVIRGISGFGNLVRLSLKSDDLDLSRTVNAISKEGINIDLITHTTESNSGAEITCIVKEDYFEDALKAIKSIASPEDEIITKKGLARVSVIGLGVRSKGIAAEVFEILEKENIEIHAVSCSEINITCIISEEDLDKAQNALHKRLIEED
jgi:aspartate kinase